SDWDGLFDAAQKIGALSDDVLPLYMYLDGGDDWGFQTLILQQGGRMMSDDGLSVTFGENDHHIEALKMARRIVTEGGYQVELDRDTQFSAFTEGRMGMWASSPAGAKRTEERVGGAFDLRTAPFTVWNDEAGLLPTGGNAAVIFGDDDAQIAATWEWVKYVTGPEGQDFVSKATGYLPTNQGSLAPELLGTYYEENPYYATPSNQYERAGPWSGYPGTQSEKIWRDQRSVIRAVMEGEIAPEEAAPQLVEIAEELMQR
ncbi:MAG: extracellular solute-binding protein, partial [Pseudomonadota bacterium]